MLRLKISGSYVDIPNDFSFTMNMKSPLFGDAGNYSYPFRIPATPRNASILSFPHRVENTGSPFRDMQSEFEWNGITLFRGTGKLRTMDKYGYEGMIYEGHGDFYYQLKNRKLQQIDFGQMTFATEAAAIAYLSSTLTKYYPEAILTCPIVRDLSYFDPPTSIEQLKYFNYLYPGNVLSVLTTSGERTVIVPQLYLRYVLDKLMTGLGYELDDRFFTTHPDYSRLMLFNATNCNNAGNNNPPRIPAGYSLTNLIFNYHVPRIGINEFLKGLENYFGIGMLVDNTNRKVKLIPLKSIINDQSYRDYSSNIISVITELDERPEGYKLSMTLDPNDEKFKELAALEDQIIEKYAGSVAELSDLPPWPMAEIGSVYWVESADAFYQMQYNKTYAVSSLLSILKTRFYYRNPQGTIESSFGTPFYDSVGLYTEVTNPMSKYDQVTPRVYFAEKYSFMGTNAMYGKNETSNFSLFFPWEKGLFNTGFKDWLNFITSAKLVKIVRQMDFPEIHEFDFSKKIMVGGLKYMVRSMQLTIRKDKIMPATLECYLVP